jgi:hypothetical protein
MRFVIHGAGAIDDLAGGQLATARAPGARPSR